MDDDRPHSSGLPRLTALTEWLTGRSAIALFWGMLAWFVTWSVVAAIVLDLVVPETGVRNIAIVATPVVPALGALFAFLTGFAINSGWAQLRDAQHAAESEADAAARLALVAGSPGLDGPGLRRCLRDYVAQLVSTEWPLLAEGRGCEVARARILDLFRYTRRVAADPDTAVPTGNDLLRAVDCLVDSRRDRLALAARTMPASLLVLTFSSGVVLCLEAVLVSLPHAQWVGLAVMALVVITSLALALLLSVAAPYRGTIDVLPRPLQIVLDELDAGLLGPVGPSCPATADETA